MAVKKNIETQVCSIHRFCQGINLTRDGYYKMRRRNKHKQMARDQVMQLILERRKLLPREGGRKLHKALMEDFLGNNIKIGRDKLFDILRDNNLLIKPKKRYNRTTNSWHRFHKFPNLIKGIKIKRPNQVWVSDITYVKLLKGYCYLALITDAYSRKIVGYDISDSLELAGCLRALKRALKQLPAKQNLIHHSDRGLQYCSNQYVKMLLDYKVKISMTEENHCYENAIAERVNGILKDEFYLDLCFKDANQVRKICQNAIFLYNDKRLHLSLNYKTPNLVHDIIVEI